ncbi:MAG TPA: serine/threonine-protein kinase [Phycisphaerales bacterium]|nr:serine/threonine-protein kinase [Phycisphaerales bacterium]
MPVDRPDEPTADLPSPGDEETAIEGPAGLPGSRVGRYRFVEILGEGGFGVVWRAEQTEPMRREVAVKVIKPGMDSRRVVARFEAERQAPAVMDHPCIARVLDGGTTGPEFERPGLPYFVMELVRGEPITAYCRSRSLPVRARLDLFARVCDAVQHAHFKGVVHRDIKPGNVLVAAPDGGPIPKVIDFGIAKALSIDAFGGPLLTEQGQMIGTPQYMSPEHAARVARRRGAARHAARGPRAARRPGLDRDEVPREGQVASLRDRGRAGGGRAQAPA